MLALQDAFDLCLAKAKGHMTRLNSELWDFPEDSDGDYFRRRERWTPFHQIGCWVPSFISGMGVMAYEVTGERPFLKWCNSFAGQYRSKVNDYAHETMHDLGFLYSPYSIKLYRLTGSEEHRQTALRAAEVLAQRFVVRGGYIKAWGRMSDNEPGSWGYGLTIIDSLMNMPLLFWAWQETGNYFYYDIAVKHCDTVAKLMIRDDCSVYHAYRFDFGSGEPIGGENYCGFGKESYWARGTTWAIYGYAVAYGYTKKPAYLELSCRLASAFIRELDEQLVPVWDFRLPEGAEPHRDSSAAAIAASAFLELDKYLEHDSTYALWADRLIARLSEPDYLNDDPSVPGLLKQSNGKDVYTVYGDFYFMEAIGKRLSVIDSCW
ncbi:unsaturated chondroitin disaccharide hydrolase [Paenibacillus sp. UNCCL117]|uniref:glycoside hydrolase family 88 protein n=1 Tax=unclassified Paenibacillus TaxID=185978 RepID=UPI00087EFDA2|nr:MULTISPECIES: glycoside hydrolase family 88 protein [unclassified Paenibacillus]SDC94766.1 unsaturated chondroitin disaccharide hydrolase [Paenibacillus sp. cl123]SFW29889.1 unsaturated chondroitin disaccharide hydrolase [Paenibacillus sp. UNCCL117]